VQAAAFSPDSRWVATASSDKTARIWNAETGEPLTPPLRHVDTLEKIKFLADGKHLLTVNRSGESWIWKLPADETPVEDLQKLACLLTSGAIAPEGASSPLRPMSLKPLWQELRTSFPARFTVLPGQVAAWHGFEAEQGETEKEWYAEAFHAQQLLATTAANPFALERLTRAKKHLLEPGGPPPGKSDEDSQK
jgi:hypothetical protein